MILKTRHRCKCMEKSNKTIQSPTLPSLSSCSQNLQFVSLHWSTVVLLLLWNKSTFIENSTSSLGFDKFTLQLTIVQVLVQFFTLFWGNWLIDLKFICDCPEGREGRKPKHQKLPEVNGKWFRLFCHLSRGVLKTFYRRVVFHQSPLQIFVNTTDRTADSWSTLTLHQTPSLPSPTPLEL